MTIARTDPPFDTHSLLNDASIYGMMFGPMTFTKRVAKFQNSTETGRNMNDADQRDDNDSESDPTIKLSHESVSGADQTLPPLIERDSRADEATLPPREDSVASVDDATMAPQDSSSGTDDDMTLPTRTVASETTPADDATLPPRDSVSEFDATLPPCSTRSSGDDTESPNSTGGTTPVVRAQAVISTLDGAVAGGSGGNVGSLRTFGDYELLHELARGGMGVVYKARQKKLNRIVALKMILTGQLASEDEVQRFYTEAEAAANLDHPGIVPIYEVGQHEDQHFFSMGYIEGESLADKVKEGPLPPREAAEVTKQVAEAIAYAHQQGVIHRDLKPANVLLKGSRESGAASRRQPASSSASQLSTLDSQPMVTDFGLAKQVESDSGLTATGQILGTPGFMPPEQASGETDRIGPTADIYSIGAILYNLLTGRPPFQSANVMDTLVAVLEQEPVAPRQLNAALDRDLETICLKCLEKDASRRYQTAEDLVDELGRYLNGKPIIARPISRVERAWRWCKRNATVATIATTILAIAFGSLGTFAYFKMIESEQQTVIAQVNARKSTYQAAMAARQALLARVQQHIAVQQTVIATAEKTNATEQGAEAELAKQAAAKARHSALRAAVKAVEAQKSADLAKLQARRAKYAGYISGITLAAAKIDAHSFKSARAILQQFVPKRKFDSDGNTLKDNQGNPVFAEDLRDWEWGRLWHLCVQQRIRYSAKGKVNAIAVDQDGKLCFVAGENGLIQVWDISNAAMELPETVPDGPSEYQNEVESKSAPKTLPGLLQNVTVWSIAVSNDGQWVAAGTNDQSGYIKIWKHTDGINYEFASSFFPRESGEASADVQSVEFSKDSEELLTGSADGTARLWRFKQPANREKKKLHLHTGAVWDASFSPDNKKIVTAGHDGNVYVWDNDKTAQTAEARVYISDAAARRFRFKQIWHKLEQKTIKPETAAKRISAIRDRTNRQSPDDEKLRGGPFTGHTNAVYSAIFLDNDHVASAGYDGRVLVWRSNEVEPLQSENVTSEYRIDNSNSMVVELGRHSKSIRALSVWMPNQTSVRSASAGNSKSKASRQFFLASASDDNTIKVWKIETDEQAFRHKLDNTLRGHSSLVRSCVFSPAGTWLLSGSHDGTLRQWNRERYEEIRKRRIYESPREYSDTLSPGSTRYVLHSAPDNTVHIRNYKTEKVQLKLEGHTDWVNSAVFSPDKKLVLTASNDDTARIWHLDWDSRLKTTNVEVLDQHDDDVTAAVFSTSGRWFLTTSRDGTANVWKASDPRKPLMTLNYGKDDQAVPVRCGTFSYDDGKTNELFVALGGEDARVWKVDFTENVATEHLELVGHAAAVTSIAFAPGVDRDGNGELDPSEDADGDGRLDIDEDTIVKNGKLDTEDLDGDGNLDVDEDTNGNGKLDLAEVDADKDGHPDVMEDTDGDGVLDKAEDLDGDGFLDINEDTLIKNGKLDPPEDADNDGNLDVDEDKNGNGKLDVGEDLDGDGRLDIDEDTVVKNGKLDLGEDFDGDGKLDTEDEDKNKNTKLDPSEDLDGDGKLDVVNEDRNGNGRFDPSEDVDGDNRLDKDEDANGNGQLDTEDVDGDGRLDKDEDRNKNRVLDQAEFISTRILTGSEDTIVKLWDLRATEFLSLKGHERAITSVSFSPDGRYVISSSLDGITIVWLASPWISKRTNDSVKQPEMEASE